MTKLFAGIVLSITLTLNPAAYAQENSSTERPATARPPCNQKLLNFDVEVVSGPQGKKIFTKALYRPMLETEMPETYTYVMQNVAEQERPFIVTVLEWRCPT